MASSRWGNIHDGPTPKTTKAKADRWHRIGHSHERSICYLFQAVGAGVSRDLDGRYRAVIVG